MLRATINLNEGIDISTFPSVIPYLKRKAEGYKPKKYLTLSKQDVDKFLSVADEKHYLLSKVILIFGVAGACRRHELVSLTTTAVHDSGTHFLVKLTDTKSKKNRSFIEIIRRYMRLRPAYITHSRFFMNYIKGECTVQPVGVHKIAGVPRVVAQFLGLENPSSYTGHCFRRTSATILANSWATMESIKRLGGWRSSTVAEGYIDESENTKISVATRILGQEVVDANLVRGSSNDETSRVFQIENCASTSSSTSGMHFYNNKECVFNIH
ncbi:uncharacterized protein LOC123314913, partial [Coccinella septempunctata]|uniref:uncharacterized protein LOC123314913 n=1 Tax=Coccinella septempunctata TaxID=41139 RepID=UPI001D0888E5